MSDVVSYDLQGVARATGFSIDVVRRAMNAGDLVPRYVTVAGRRLAKPVFERDEVVRWVRAGSTERVAS